MEIERTAAADVAVFVHRAIGSASEMFPGAKNASTPGRSRVTIP
jgi:hypothetical protein